MTADVFPEVVRLDEHGIAERIWSLAEGPLLFGRGAAEGNAVPFSESLSRVSRRHAEIRRGLLGGWVLRDLGSKDGTRVNGTRVTRCSLNHNDTILIGGVSFKFRDPTRQTFGELKVVRGPRRGEAFPLDNGDVLIGRKVTSPHGICFPESAGAISHVHCRVRKKRNDFFLDDLRSRNGVLVNEKRVVGSVLLQDGDGISLGDVVLKVRIRKGPG